MADFAQMLFQNASKTISETTPDVNKALQDGATLALKKQQLEAQKQNLELARRQIQGKQWERFGKALQAGDKLKDSASRNVYYKDYLPNLMGGLGISLPPATMEMIKKSPEARLKFQALISDVQNGQLTFDEAIATAQSPEELALYDGDALLEAEQLSMQEARKERESESRLALSEAQFEATRADRKARMEVQQAQRFDQNINQISNAVQGAFERLNVQKSATRLAYNTINEVKQDLQKGKKASVISFNAASKALAKVFDSGAMTDQDVADFRNLTGWKNISADAINKWFSGDVNFEAVNQVQTLTNRVAKNLDRDTEKTYRALKSRLSINAFKDREPREIENMVGLTANRTRTLDSPPKPENSFKLFADQTKARVRKLRGAGKSDQAIRNTLQKLYPKLTERQLTEIMEGK